MRQRLANSSTIAWVAATTTLIVCVASPAASAQPNARSHKVIDWGWGTPDPDYVRDHIREMEEVPFDGLVLDLPCNPPRHGDSKDYLGWRVWQSQPIDVANYSESIAALNEIDFDKFTDNFLRFNVTPEDVDWFSDGFEGVLANVRAVAKIAKDAGCVGILFDVEQYRATEPPHQPFSYPVQAGAGEHSFDEYRQQVRLRGQQFMRAINEGFGDDAVVLMTFGYDMPHMRAKLYGMTWDQESYGLLPSFIDGMLETAADATVVYDGWEHGYAYRNESQFRTARKTMRDTNRQWSAVPRDFSQHYRASFGLWIDQPDQGSKWNPTDTRKNYFTPEAFEQSVRSGLTHTDGYVWIYSEHARWWTDKTIPQAYFDALARAKQATTRPTTNDDPPSP